MKKIIYVFMFMALLFVVNACRDDSQMFSNEDNGLELVKANEKVINLIKDFSLMANNGNVISKATSNFVVNSITKKTITCFIEAAKARSTESTSVDIYSVEFTKDGQKGFSIATDDDRLNRIFAYSENGELGDTIFNDGLKMFVNGIVKMNFRNIMFLNLKQLDLWLLRQFLILYQHNGARGHLTIMIVLLALLIQVDIHY